MNLLEFINSHPEKQRIPDGEIGRVIGSMTGTIPDTSLPVNVEKSDWLVSLDPERLVKTFYFKKFSHLGYFINELLVYQERSHHHANIIINHYEITIETHTKDINLVTEQDKNLANFCDEIYEDIKFLGLGQGEI